MVLIDKRNVAVFNILDKPKNHDSAPPCQAAGHDSLWISTFTFYGLVLSLAMLFALHVCTMCFYFLDILLIGTLTSLRACTFGFFYFDLLDWTFSVSSVKRFDFANTAFSLCYLCHTVLWAAGHRTITTEAFFVKLAGYPLGLALQHNYSITPLSSNSYNTLACGENAPTLRTILVFLRGMRESKAVNAVGV